MLILNMVLDLKVKILYLFMLVDGLIQLQPELDCYQQLQENILILPVKNNKCNFYKQLLLINGINFAKYSNNI